MFTEKIVSCFLGDISRVTIGVINGLICIFIILFGSRIISNRKKVIDRKKILIVLRKCMIPLVVFLAVEMVVVVITLDELAAVSSNPNDKTISAILGILSMISIGILFVIVIYIKNTNDRMEHFLIVKEQLQQLQINYYETLLEKEKATKKYRHDMNNHLICLNRLVKDGDLPRTQDYIEEMSNQMESIEKKSVETGNNILDVLLNYYMAQLEERVSVQVLGKCIHNIKVSDVDLCIIFSNIIQNAVEAIAKSQEAAPIFKVEIVSGRHFVKIVIKNSLNVENIQFNKGGGLKTTKDDQYNHGIGIQNSKETVYRNKGEIDFTIEEKYFVCKVLLPIESE